MISDYFEYEREIARNHLVPLLARHNALAAPLRMLDVGCGYGGVLLAVKEAVPECQATGLDRDGAMVREGQKRLGAAAQLVISDFFEWSGGPFDLILMRDVLEHIGDPEGALARAVSMLEAGGFLFVSFAPYFGPFGGHQHNGSGLCSYLPWVQILPATWLRRLLSVRGNTYKTEGELKRDVESVLATRLTLRRFQRVVAASKLRLCFRTAYLSRPDYKIKFGLRPVRLPPVAAVIEVLATGVEALLQKHSG